MPIRLSENVQVLDAALSTAEAGEIERFCGSTPDPTVLTANTMLSTIALLQAILTKSTCGIPPVNGTHFARPMKQQQLTFLLSLAPIKLQVAQPAPGGLSPDMDAPWIEAYRRLVPTDAVHPFDGRRSSIAREMRELRSASSLQEGIYVIGWWAAAGWEVEDARDQFIRRAMRQLKASRTLAKQVLIEGAIR